MYILHPKILKEILAAIKFGRQVSIQTYMYFVHFNLVIQSEIAIIIRVGTILQARMVQTHP